MNALLLLLLQGLVEVSCRQRKSQVTYPLSPIVLHTPSFSSVIHKNRLTCFGNREHKAPSVTQVLICLASLPLTRRWESAASVSRCKAVFGSTSIRVRTNTSTEIYRVNRLPEDRTEVATLSVTRWLMLSADGEGSDTEVLKLHPAEPLFLCARCNDWRLTEQQGRLQVDFEYASLRTADISSSKTRLLVHLAAMTLISSVAVIPYLAALVVALLVYEVGLNYFILIVGLSCLVVSLAPFMLTRTSRTVIYQYVRTNLGRHRPSHSDADKLIREKLPLLQATFLACLVVCAGSAASLLSFVYLGADRETRNYMIKATFSAAAFLLTFFICQSLERFFAQWFWLIVAFSLARAVERQLNPLSRDKVLIVSMLWSFLLKLSLPYILRATRISRALSYVASTSLRLGLGTVLTRLRRKSSVTELPKEPELYDGFFDANGLELLAQDDADAIVSELGLGEGEEEEQVVRPLTPKPGMEAQSLRALIERAQGVDLACLDIYCVSKQRSPSPHDDEEDEEEEEEGEGEAMEFIDVPPSLIPFAPAMAGLVGGAPVPLCAVGPLELDGRVLWLPLLSTDSSLVLCAQSGCEISRKCRPLSVVSVTSVSIVEAVISTDSTAQAMQLNQWLARDMSVEVMHSLGEDIGVSVARVVTNVAGKRLLVRLLFFILSSGDSRDSEDTASMDRIGARLLRGVIDLVRSNDTYAQVLVVVPDASCRTQLSGSISVLLRMDAELLSERGTTASALLDTHAAINAHERVYTDSWLHRLHSDTASAFIGAVGGRDSSDGTTSVSMELLNDVLEVEFTTQRLIDQHTSRSEWQQQCMRVLGGDGEDHWPSRVLAVAAAGMYVSYLLDLTEDASAALSKE